MRAAGVHLRNADARLFADLSRTFDEFKPTKVVQLAAIASAVEARKDPGLAFDLQLVTLRNVLELCRQTHDSVNQVMLLSLEHGLWRFRRRYRRREHASASARHLRQHQIHGGAAGAHLQPAARRRLHHRAAERAVRRALQEPARQPGLHRERADRKTIAARRRRRRPARLHLYRRPGARHGARAGAAPGRGPSPRPSISPSAMRARSRIWRRW